MSDERTHVDEQRPTATDQRSTLQILGQVADDVGTLVRKEIQLARQEITEGAIAKAKGGAAFAVAAVLGLFFLGFVAAAGAAKLAQWMEAWQAILIVAGVFLMMAVVAALVGMVKMRTSMAPDKARQAIKEDLQWARAQLRR
jgi:protein-S-isoprenylcysteine O-methyltransferase Ste14